MRISSSLWGEEVTNVQNQLFVKIANAFFAVIFLVSAFIQHNDPDPLLWMSIYGYGALVCMLAIFGKDSKILHYAGLVFFVSYAVYLFFNHNGVYTWFSLHSAENITGSMSDDKPWIEASREFFGLLILNFAHILNLLFRKSFRNKRTQTVDQ
ncbi:transmembrane 220 family protein [Zunongwangia sp. F260]|uniref:Transmembrane 220 family protein n=1 Tax=Autumnicola lenta TaxID=3075593 RepID=A0ABU3CJB4_9FLAO|nr:transmembrane 220 family protein [Zunongwangia sp. F260]MDT0646448.1 transmembrane 220 family protein [Zunongwangia sp. F260]